MVVPSMAIWAPDRGWPAAFCTVPVTVPRLGEGRCGGERQGQEGKRELTQVLHGLLHLLPSKRRPVHVGAGHPMIPSTPSDPRAGQRMTVGVMGPAGDLPQGTRGTRPCTPGSRRSVRWLHGFKLNQGCVG